MGLPPILNAHPPITMEFSAGIVTAIVRVSPKLPFTYIDDVVVVDDDIVYSKSTVVFVEYEVVALEYGPAPLFVAAILKVVPLASIFNHLELVVFPLMREVYGKFARLTTINPVSVECVPAYDTV